MIAQNRPSIDSSCNIAQNYNYVTGGGGRWGRAANVGILAAIAQKQEQRSN